MAVVTTNLGAVTAYADAVAGGYTGTKAEWQALMASYGSVAEQAAESASQAADSASAASTKASEATTAAASATTAKNDAETAKNAAETAQGKAETAQGAAEQAAQSVSASAAQIATNTSDITELKSDLTTKADATDMLKAFPTDTASGAIASFSDGANVPVKSLIVNIDHVQEGSGDPSPDNVRPISGWDAVNVQRTGKNLIESESITGKTVNGITFSKNADGSINIKGTATANVSVSGNNIGTIKSGTYTISGGEVLPSGIWVSISNKFELMLSVSAPSKTSAVDDIDNAYLFIFINNGVTIDLTLHIQLELGSAATAYEPYQPITPINIALGQTVYGGTLDVVSGELVIDRAMVDLGTLIWAKRVSGVFYTWSLQNLVKAVSSTAQTANAKCSALKLGAYNDVYNNATLDYAISVGADSQIGAHCSAYAEAADFKSAMSGETLVYELATPITVQLTPHEVQSLRGQNHVWADTGDVEVEYRADTKLYIQRLTQPTEDDLVANSTITSGQFFMIGNTLYRALANIASGATITVGTNAQRVSLADALNLVNA